MQATANNILQIDCNNPEVDSCVATRFGTNSEPLEVTARGRTVVVGPEDNAPYGCPLTQPVTEQVRSVESFVLACSDCTHVNITKLPLATTAKSSYV